MMILKCPPALALIPTLLSGCAALPNYVEPELIHQSHAVQHFGPEQSSYGSEAIAVDAHWNLPKHFALDLSEGLALDKRQTFPGYINGSSTMYGYGEVLGPREQFTARIGYKFQINHDR